MAKNELQNKVDCLALKRITLLDENKNHVPFSKLWERGSVIVVFVRHFGCFACKGHVKDIMRNKEAIAKKRVVFIGNGIPGFIRTFKEDIGEPNAEIYTDPTQESFRACGMLNGMKYLLNLGTMKSVMKKTEFSSDKYQKDMGDAKQLGGVVGLQKPGLVLYHFVSTYVGEEDDPNLWPDDDDD